MCVQYLDERNDFYTKYNLNQNTNMLDYNVNLVYSVVPMNRMKHNTKWQWTGSKQHILCENIRRRHYIIFLNKVTQ